MIEVVESTTPRTVAKAPVFVCGMGRSGTTWVGRTLGQSPELVYIGEAWLIGKLEELGDWFRKIAEDWGTHTVWHRSGMDRGVFLQHVARFYLGLLDGAAGGQRFVEKTTSWNALHLRFLAELFPQAYYVLVYRDGRNQVASLEAKNLESNKSFDFEASCSRWSRAMGVFEEVSTSAGTLRCRLVRYENLLTDFDREFADLCRFVEIAPFVPEQPTPNSSFKDEGEMSNFNRRWDSWTAERRELFGRVAGAQLVKWGYAESPHAW